jgi:hypothetical protein
MKKLRLFANRDRETRTRIAYIALTAGTVLIAFLLVLLNRWIFGLSEKALYDDPQYEAVSIISANGIGAPLPFETRVALFLGCDRQGDERAVMPSEIGEAEITERIKALWSDTIAVHAPSGKLVTGESAESMLRKSRYQATLRDFYNDGTGAKLSLWCAQAYYSGENGQTCCLSVQFDSRTGEVYSLNCALFDSVLPEQTEPAIALFLTANGYADSLAEQAALSTSMKGYTGTLTLPDGLKLSITYNSGEQYEITFVR